jgi:hypothetical protein
MINTFVDIDELLETEKNLMRTIGSQSETIVKLEEEVAQLREMATDLYRWSPACGLCHPSREWMCPMCKYKDLIEGWEVDDA